MRLWVQILTLPSSGEIGNCFLVSNGFHRKILTSQYVLLSFIPSTSYCNMTNTMLLKVMLNLNLSIMGEGG